MADHVMEWVKAVGPVILSWPVAVLIGVIAFRKPITRILGQFGGDDVRRLKAGSFEIERLAEQGQQAVTKLNRISEVMAESRLLELEITREFGQMFSKEQQQRMTALIEELRQLLEKQDGKQSTGTTENWREQG